MNTKFVIVALLFFSLSAQARIEAVIGSVPLKKNPNLSIMPQINEDEIIISRDQYVISYNKERRSPNWTAWKLEDSDIGSTDRTKDFSPDPDLQTYLAKNGGGATVVQSSEYKGTCFDRGHQIPSKDRTDSVANNEETFLTSNIVPQTTYLNRSIWEGLERYARTLTKQGKKLYIIAGPVYDEDFGSIGPQNDIPVPSKEFKIIFVLSAGQTPADIDAKTETIAVLMPNILSDGTKPFNAEACAKDILARATAKTPPSWEQYKTTVAKIQKISGVDLPF